MDTNAANPRQNAILILTALNREALAIRKALSGREILVEVIGMRGVFLDRIPPRLLQSRHIIVAGLGGGLRPSLAIGDVVVDGPDWLALPAGAQRGRIATTEQVLFTPDAKRRFADSTGADIVDMEQAIVRRTLGEYGERLIGVRAVSDTADEYLDAALPDWVDELGRPKPLVLASAVMRRPARFRSLLRLAQQSKLGLRSLVSAIGVMVDRLDSKSTETKRP